MKSNRFRPTYLLTLSHRRYIRRSKRKPIYDPAGQALLEYALLIALVAIVAVGGLTVAGGGVGDSFEQVVEAIRGEAKPTVLPPTPQDVTVQVVDHQGTGIAHVCVFAFDAQGTYLEQTGETDQAGEIVFPDVAPGTYAFRADYQARQFWSSTVTVPGQTKVVIQTGQRPFTVRVIRASGDPLPDVSVYAFTGEADRYTGVGGMTNDDGLIIFSLVDGDYKFRADYQNAPYWSEKVNSPQSDSTTIQVAPAEFTLQVVDERGEPLKNVHVHVFKGKDKYTGISGKTDAQGNIVFELMGGDYVFRADHKGHAYWSEQVSIPRDTAATLRINPCDALALGEVKFLGEGGGLDGGRVALRVEGAGVKTTITSVEVFWDYFDSLPEEKHGKKRLYGVYLCPGNSYSCDAKGRFFNIIDYKHHWDSNLDDTTSASTANDNPRTLPANGGYIIFDFDSLPWMDYRKIDGPPWYLEPGDFGFTVHFNECPASKRSATRR